MSLLKDGLNAWGYEKKETKEQPRYVKKILAGIIYVIFLGCLVVKSLSHKLSKIRRFFCTT